jgi:2-methylaconitate cis-trans-isomerase PrpF
MTIQHRPDFRVPCVVMRGGTTRGFFFRPEHIPSDPAIRDRLLLDIVAGQDLRAADGLGGNDMLLNKVVEVWKSERPDADVECTFGVITPASARVKYGSNCGNLVSAVALYAVEEGLCTNASGTVRLFNPQSGTRIDARFMEAVEFRERAARAKSMGMVLSGVPVELAFIDPASTIGRGLLPSGRAVDRLTLPSGAEIEASIVDSGTVYVFVAAGDLGLDYATAPLDGEQRRALQASAEHLRGQAAALCGLAERPEDALRLSPAVPKIALVSPPHDYVFDNGRDGFVAREVDMLGRIISSQNFHTSYAVTGAMATIAAAVVPDSVVNRAVGGAVASPLTLRIGHPSGMIEPRQDWRAGEDGVVIERAYAIRTTRRLMTGSVHLAQVAQPHAAARTNVVTTPMRRRATDAPAYVTGAVPR